MFSASRPPAGQAPDPPCRTPGRRTVLTAATAAATIAALAAAVPASAAPSQAAARVTPAAAAQPKNFTIGKAAAWPGTAVIAANGTAYLAYTAYTSKSEGFASAWVCVLPRGARKCSATTQLTPIDSATSLSNQPDSMVLGPDGTVDVLITTFNDANSGDRTTSGADADTLEFVLAASGKIESKSRVGTLDQQGTALRVGGQLMWTSGGDDASQ
ncbi:MAG TPA: hypothetical protein VGG25_29820, partial [Streptosporangiaceae bacterium]